MKIPSSVTALPVKKQIGKIRRFFRFAKKKLISAENIQSEAEDIPIKNYRASRFELYSSMET